MLSVFSGQCFEFLRLSGFHPLSRSELELPFKDPGEWGGGREAGIHRRRSNRMPVFEEITGFIES